MNDSKQIKSATPTISSSCCLQNALYFLLLEAKGKTFPMRNYLSTTP
jgi:hypothetical protein